MHVSIDGFEVAYRPDTAIGDTLAASFASIEVLRGLERSGVYSFAPLVASTAGFKGKPLMLEYSSKGPPPKY